MSIAAAAGPSPLLDARTDAAAGSLLSRRRLHPPGRIGRGFSFTWITLLVILSLTVQWLPLKNYGFAVGNLNTPPHWGRELFGTDIAGRSMLSRTLYGARMSIGISAAATFISGAIGNIIGLLSAYFGSWISMVGEVIANTILSVPGLLLLLVITLSIGSSIPVLVGACALIFIPQFLRLSRANGSRELTQEYLYAARGLGASRSRIIFRELLPNTWQALISYAALVMPAVMVLEGSLSFLGYGVQPPTPSWGNMISIGLQQFNTSPWPVLIPCIFLGITVFSLVTIGEYLRVRLGTGK